MWLVGLYFIGRRSDLPYDAVESCDAEKVPFGGNPAPELIPS